MINLDELPIDLQVCDIFVFRIGLRSELEPKRSITLPYFLRKAHLRKFIYGLFHTDRYGRCKTNQFYLTIWMAWFLSFMVWLFHHFYLTGLFPNVLNSTHVTVDIQSDDVLEVIEWKSVIEVVNNIAPFNLDVEDVVSNQLLHIFGFFSMVDDLDLTVAFIQNKLQ